MMDNSWMLFYDHLVDRVSGPFKLRFVLQPTMALILAVSAGIRDAKAGKPPYFWSLVNDPAHRREMLRDGWKSIGKVFVVALILDVVYQLVVLHFVYPGELMVIAILLAIVPYVLVRGLVTRLVRGRFSRVRS